MVPREPDDLEIRFETPRLFSEETPEQSLGRLAWLGALGRAEILLLLASLKVPVQLVPAIMTGLDALLSDLGDNLAFGFGVSSLDMHPDLERVESLVDDILVAITDHSPEASKLEDAADDYMLTVGAEGIESLALALAEAVKKWEKNSQKKPRGKGHKPKQHPQVFYELSAKTTDR